MKKIIKAVALVSAFALLAACGGPTMDGKNQMAFEQSVASIVQEMSPDEVSQFSNDLHIVSVSVMEELGEITMENIDKMGEMMLKKLDGKTPSDLHKMAEKIRNN